MIKDTSRVVSRSQHSNTVRYSVTGMGRQILYTSLVLLVVIVILGLRLLGSSIIGAVTLVCVSIRGLQGFRVESELTF
jgi:hypothetical protein